MSLVGKLEDLPGPALLSAISNGGKTGKLTVTRERGYVVLVFRLGAMIYASCDAVRETLGGLLVAKGHITDETLNQALDMQHRVGESRRVGRILLDIGAVDVGVLEEALRQQFEAVLLHLFRWDSGYFRFEVLEEPANDGEALEVEVDLRDLLLHEGVSTKQVMMEVMRLQDEASRDQPSVTTGGVSRSTLSEYGDDELLASMRQLRRCSGTSDLSRVLLDGAKAHFLRSALFLRRGDELRCLNQVGVEEDGEQGLERLRELRIAADPPSVLSDVVRTKKTFLGKLGTSYWDEYLIRGLGSTVPEESAVIPVIVGSQCALVLYGDNLPTGQTIGSLAKLEILLDHAGLTIQQWALKKRLAKE